MEIAIIGGGICGLYLAWKLSEKRIKVTVFEKNKKIGKQTCSGLFSQRILDFIPQSHNLIQKRIEHALLHFPKKTVKIGFSKEFFVIKHYELDRLLALLAEKEGAKIILNKKIDSFPEGFDRIIGCDGAVSQTRKLLELKEPRYRLGIQGFVPEKISSNPETESAHRDVNFVETWPRKSGFLWKIPGEKEVEYGVIEKVDRAKEVFDKFLKENDIHLEGMKSALIPQGFIVPSHSKITLCGDAAGLTKPWSGGGVIWALMAADILLKSFPDFLEYRKNLKKFFSSKIIFSKIATELVYFSGFNIPMLLPKNVKIEGDFLI